MRMAMGHGMVLLATSLQRTPPGSTLSFQRLGLDGSLLGEPTLVEFPADVTLVQVAAVHAGWVAYGYGANTAPFASSYRRRQHRLLWSPCRRTGGPRAS